MYRVLIILFVLVLFTLCIFSQKVMAEERDDDFSLKKKDYKMDRKDYSAQILMILILAALAFALG